MSVFNTEIQKSHLERNCFFDEPVDIARYDKVKYPQFEKENDIQGNVYLRFVVTNEGEINSPTILRGVSGAKYFDKEVLRIIGLMPRWIPGENNGKKVNVYFTMPIKFKLD